jgi:hypothetical protein
VNKELKLLIVSLALLLFTIIYFFLPNNSDCETVGYQNPHGNGSALICSGKVIQEWKNQ